MTVVQFALYAVITILTIYPVVDRVCKCIEHKHIAESYEHYSKYVKEQQETEEKK